MAFGSVHVPAGCTFKIGDSVGGLATMGVLKGDSAIEITYDLIEALGSQAEEVLSYAKNMRAVATCELYQLHLPNIEKILDGIATVTSQAGVLQAGVNDVVNSGDWEYDKFIPFVNQNGDGSSPTVNSVTGSVDGALVEDTDFFVIMNEAGVWGYYVIDSATVTTEAQNLTANTDYTPAASKTLKMGSPSASLTAKIVEFSKTQNSKIFRVRLWSAKNEAGLTIGFPDSNADEPTSMPISLSGRLDSDKTDGEQLIEIYDEIGITV